MVIVPTTEPVDLGELDRIAADALLSWPESALYRSIRALIAELRYHRANAAEAEARGARKVLEELAFGEFEHGLFRAFEFMVEKYAQKGDGNADG